MIDLPNLSEIQAILDGMTKVSKLKDVPNTMRDLSSLIPKESHRSKSRRRLPTRNWKI